VSECKPLSVGRYLLIATPPLEVAVFEVILKGELTMRGGASVSLRALRHISLSCPSPGPG